MKRIVVTLFLAVFVLLTVLASTFGTSSARISPITTPPNPLPMDGQIIESQEVITSPDGSQIIVQYFEEEILSPTPTPRPTIGATITPEPFSMVYLPFITSPGYVNANVMVIVYEGVAPTFDPEYLTTFLIDSIRNGTTWHSISGTLPSVSFSLWDGNINVVNGFPPTMANGYYNMNAIYQQFDICNRIANGSVDEVWIFSDGRPGHIYSDVEFVASASTWRIATAGGLYTPYCGRQVYTMFLNFDASPDNALESWVHSAEFSWLLFASGGYESCDILPASIYTAWMGRQSQCSGAHAYSDQYAFMTRPAAANNNVSMCGEAHLALNVPASTLAYDPARTPKWLYISNSTTSAANRCNDWQWGNVTSSQTISCTVWGCNKGGWLTYYIQNAPGLNNNSHGRDGTIRPNWWSFRMPQ
jgi:hypothetical protein